MKMCRTCEKLKPDSHFRGKRRICKACLSAKVQAWKKKNPEAAKRHRHKPPSDKQTTPRRGTIWHLLTPHVTYILETHPMAEHEIVTGTCISHLKGKLMGDVAVWAYKRGFLLRRASDPEPQLRAQPIRARRPRPTPPRKPARRSKARPSPRSR